MKAVNHKVEENAHKEGESDIKNDVVINKEAGHKLTSHLEDIGIGKNDKRHKSYKAALQEYADGYEVVSKEAFDKQALDIAEKIDGLAKSGQTYSFVTSKPGKSNFWLMEEVLKKTESDPTSIHIMPVKESGVAKDEIAKDVQEEIAGNDNHVLIFLDDAAYSGSQFSKVLGQFNEVDSKKIKIAQIARSDDALNKIKGLRREDKGEINEGNDLVAPIKIKKAEKNTDILTDIATRSEPRLKDGKTHDAGLYQTAMYYKVPDYASTMVYLPIFKNNKDTSDYKGGQEPYKKQEYLEERLNIKDKKGLIDKDKLSIARSGRGELLPQEQLNQEVFKDIKISEVEQLDNKAIALKDAERMEQKWQEKRSNPKVTSPFQEMDLGIQEVSIENALSSNKPKSKGKPTAKSTERVGAVPKEKPQTKQKKPGLFSKPIQFFKSLGIKKSTPDTSKPDVKDEIASSVQDHSHLTQQRKPVMGKRSTLAYLVQKNPELMQIRNVMTTEIPLKEAQVGKHVGGVMENKGGNEDKGKGGGGL